MKFIWILFSLCLIHIKLSTGSILTDSKYNRGNEEENVIISEPLTDKESEERSNEEQVKRLIDLFQSLRMSNDVAIDYFRKTLSPVIEKVEELERSIEVCGTQIDQLVIKTKELENKIEILNKRFDKKEIIETEIEVKPKLEENSTMEGNNSSISVIEEVELPRVYFEEAFSSPDWSSNWTKFFSSEMGEIPNKDFEWRNESIQTSGRGQYGLSAQFPEFTSIEKRLIIQFGVQMPLRSGLHMSCDAGFLRLFDCLIPPEQPLPWNTPYLLSIGLHNCETQNVLVFFSGNQEARENWYKDKISQSAGSEEKILTFTLILDGEKSRYEMLLDGILVHEYELKKEFKGYASICRIGLYFVQFENEPTEFRRILVTSDSNYADQARNASISRRDLEK